MEQRWTVLLTMVIVTLVSGSLVIVGAMQKEYVANASFFPQEPASGSGRLAGLAAQFGVSVPAGGTVESPEFYGGLLRSRRILAELAEDTFTISTDEGPVHTDLITLFGPEDPPSREAAKQMAVGRLRENHITIGVARETGVVSYEVSAPDPELAHAMAERILDLVHEFNVGTRQGRAAAERDFVEDRLGEAQNTLTETERELQLFLEQNRQFQDSPELLFRYERLQRQVAMRQEIVTSLVQALEEARLDQLRSTPVVTVVERPEVPARAQPYPLFRNLLIALLFSGMAGLAVGLGRGAMVHSTQTDEGGYRRWQAALATLEWERGRLLRR